MNTPESFELDNLDKKILSFLNKDARMPYTEIAKKLEVSPGTIHVRMKKMESAQVIKGASLNINYEMLGYNFIAYIGIMMSKAQESFHIIERLKEIPEVTVAHLATGKFGVFCKIRCKSTGHAKEVLYKINSIDGVVNTETMISLEECINSNVNLIQSIID
ncbi:MAG: AsnC family transcriptional regulator [Schleiferiaceae bacterium]|nr:AsnC family transcriptional regulator [Schleiferiaceae bacterium]